MDNADDLVGRLRALGAVGEHSATPSPWYVEEDKRPIATHRICEVATGYTMAYGPTFDADSRATRVANAQLMAMAPTLRLAVVEAADEIERLRGSAAGLLLAGDEGLMSLPLKLREANLLLCACYKIEDDERGERMKMEASAGKISTAAHAEIIFGQIATRLQAILDRIHYLEGSVRPQDTKGKGTTGAS